MRRKYKVTLNCDDGTAPIYTVWAETPEHAIKKAGERHGTHPLVVNSIAEEIPE